MLNPGIKHADGPARHHANEVVIGDACRIDGRDPATITQDSNSVSQALDLRHSM